MFSSHTAKATKEAYSCLGNHILLTVIVIYSMMLSVCVCVCVCVCFHNTHYDMDTVLLYS